MTRTLTFRVRQLPSSIEEVDVIGLVQQVLIPRDTPPTIKVHSLARSLTPLDAQPSKTATVTIVPFPLFLRGQTEKSFEAHFNGCKYNITIDLHFLDFTVLNEINDDEHILDCIAISGLGSHPFGSWQQRGDESGYMWLRDGVPEDLRGTRTIIYGYDTQVSMSRSFQDIYDLAGKLVDRLSSVGFMASHSKPVVFLAHSLGGILLKESLVMLQSGVSDQQASLLENLKCIVFFGVPHRGMETLQLMTMVKGNPNEQLVKTLSPESEYLRELDRRFNGTQSLRKFRVVSFHETATTKTVEQSDTGVWTRSGPGVKMVERDSAVQRCSRDLRDVHPINEDHSAMVKFHRNDANYEIVLDCIRGVLEALQTGRSEEIPITLNRRRTTRGRDKPFDAASLAGASEIERQHESKGGKDGISEDILNSLKSSIFDRRLTDISPHWSSTFGWIFLDETLEFYSWLREGRDTYWIHGKPGSGKSTLMKYLYEHSTTSELLAGWKESGILIKAGFFFYYRGSTIQKSFEGLVRSILYQILSQAPDLCGEIPKHCLPRGRSHKFNWTLTKLQNALSGVLRQRRRELSICLFIDALDEFDGHLESISGFIESLVSPEPGSSTRCKVCFSSRPRDIIRKHFGKASNFQIHHYTQNDIQQYTSGRMNECTRLVNFVDTSQRSREEVHLITQEIIRKADGVFLWVRLALDNILKSFSDTEQFSLKDFMSILQGLPSELDEFYTSIIERIPQDFRWDAYLTLDVLLRAAEEPTLLDLHWIITGAGSQTLHDCAERRRRPMDAANFGHRLRDRCGALIEIGEYSASEERVRLMHETVREFVSRSSFRRLMVGEAARFRLQNAYTELAKFHLTTFKYFGSFGQVRLGNEPLLQSCMVYCYLAEITTQTPQTQLLDSLQPEDFYRFRKAGTLQRNLSLIPVSALSFAVASCLILYVKGKVNTSKMANVTSSKKPLLHFVVEAAHGLDVLARQPHAITHKFTPNYAGMAGLLLSKGSRWDVAYHGLTPFERLFLVAVSTANPLDDKFIAALPYQSERAISLAEAFLEHGQDQNMDIFVTATKQEKKDKSRQVLRVKPMHLAFTDAKWEKKEKRGKKDRPGKTLRVKPIHLSFGRMLEILLNHNADPNSRDEKGRTALDFLILRVAVLVQDLPKPRLDDMRLLKVSIDLLIEKGGYITLAGLESLPACLWYFSCQKYSTGNLEELPQRSKAHGFLSSSDILRTVWSRALWKVRKGKA